jgi:hypothetical protein
MKKRSLMAIIMVIAFVFASFIVVSQNGTSNNGTQTGPGGGMTSVTGQDVNGEFVPD